MLIQAVTREEKQKVTINMNNVACFFARGEDTVIIHLTDGKHVIIHANYDDFMAQLSDYYRFNKGYKETLSVEEPSAIIKE